MEYVIENVGQDPFWQSKAVRLLGRCFPDYWEQRAAREENFPFTEYSFIARTPGGEVTGHAGLMPFSVSDGKEGVLRFAGLASVAVAPECRGQGIAAQLCRSAALWAEAEGFDVLPLFTAFGRVYRCNEWQDYSVAGPQRLRRPRRSAAPLFRSGDALSSREKEIVMTSYERAPRFFGKVVRGTGKAFHDWPRIFAEPAFRFAVTPCGYALSWDGVIAEVAAEGEMLPFGEGEEESVVLFLPPGHPAWEELANAGWRPSEEPPPDVYHGEHVMVRPGRRSLPDGCFFPLVDKF